MLFPGQSANNGLLEAGGVQTIWAEFDPNGPNCVSRIMSVSVDASLGTSTGATYNVVGSNEGPSTYGDETIVPDELGSVAAKAITAGQQGVGFSRPNFPYKYIGIKFTPGSGTVTGKVAFYYNSSDAGSRINP